MMFIYKTAQFAPVWTTILKIRAIFVHQTLTEHAIYLPGLQDMSSKSHLLYAN